MRVYRLLSKLHKAYQGPPASGPMRPICLPLGDHRGIDALHRGETQLPLFAYTLLRQRVRSG
jgi:hypothetical protein